LDIGEEGSFEVQKYAKAMLMTVMMAIKIKKTKKKTKNFIASSHDVWPLL
jgi:hypothetical protein